MRHLRRSLLATPLVALAAIMLGLPSVALGTDDRGDFTARLAGFHEVPSVFSDGQGTLRLHFRQDRVDFTLRYSNLSLAPAVAHLHFGERHVNGGVFVFLCGGGGQPLCPDSTSGTVQGSFRAANILAPSTAFSPGGPSLPQGLPAGNLDAAKRAIRAGAAYANMHTPPNWPGGEIRGQVVRD
jgi:hypothetical protein